MSATSTPRPRASSSGWGKDLPPTATLALVVHLDRAAGAEHEAAALRDAIHESLRTPRNGGQTEPPRVVPSRPVEPGIALAFLAVALAIGRTGGRHFPDSRLAVLVREGVLIVGWVAMWRPIEIFLYDWWPIGAERRLFQRLAVMPVRIEYRSTTPADAWRSDWPAMSVIGTPSAGADGLEFPGPL